MHELFLFGDNGNLKETVNFLLSKLPPEVSLHLQETCIIVVINDSLNGYYVPEELVEGKSIIVINYRIFLKSYDVFVKTFFHEVAHHWLKHDVLFGKDRGREKRQEEEAERLLRQWIQDAESSRMYG